MKLSRLFANPIFCAVLVFIAAAIFRLTFLDLIEFKLDEAIWIYEITRFFLKPYLVTATFAPISIGLFYFPLPMYVFILFSALSRNPIVVSFVIALFNIMGMVFFYFMLRKFYGNRVAIFSSLLLSLSPWSILFSRKIWTPDLFLPFAVVFFYFVHKVGTGRDLSLQKIGAKSWFFLGLAGSLLLQIHIPGLVIVLITAGILIFMQYVRNGFKPFPTKKIIAGFIAGFIFAIPYILRLLFKIGCQGPCLRVPPVYQPFTSFDLFHFLRPFEYLTGLNFGEVLGKSYADFLNTFPIVRFINLMFIVELAVPLIGIYYVLTVKKNLRFLAVYLVIFPLLYFMSKTTGHMYYYIVLSPIIAIVAGLGMNYIFNNTQKIANYFAIILFVTFLFSNILFESLFYIFINKQKMIIGDYGPTFRLTKAYIEKETSQYNDQTFSDEVKAYAYLYPEPQLIHGKLGEYFAQKQEPYFAIDEYKKQLRINLKDIASRANLIYIRIVTGDYNQAEKELKVLERLDATASADLKRILNQAKEAGVKK